jgi:hypothetical protein
MITTATNPTEQTGVPCEHLVPAKFSPANPKSSATLKHRQFRSSRRMGTAQLESHTIQH